MEEECTILSDSKEYVRQSIRLLDAHAISEKYWATNKDSKNTEHAQISNWIKYTLQMETWKECPTDGLAEM